MSSTLLENLRSSHELSELFEAKIGDLLEDSANGQKAKVWQQHRINDASRKVTALNSDLLRNYSDNNMLLREELSAMKGSEIFSSFYESLNSTREYYEKFPAVNFQQKLCTDVNVDVQFSGEEIFGKYLDLNLYHAQFSNLTQQSLKDLDYLQYLDRFNTFFYVPSTIKSTNAYAEYLNDLWQYLHTFYERVNPLVNLQDTCISQWEAEFDVQWRNGEGKAAGGGSTESREPLRLGMFNAAEELEALGMDRLKQGLEALGLKCGGSLKDRAKRLWSVRGKKREEYPPGVLAKPSTAAATAGASPKYPWADSVSWRELRISKICEAVMPDVVAATRKHAEKQQSRSAEEREAEVREEEFGVSAYAAQDSSAGALEDGDEDEPLYNPLNLPLGWDGKPIPFWLYKLHGLGVEYKCEVCDNHSYWGRRAFDRHFQEWKHAHGMRCLGVPNTKHFHDITLIEDVLALHAKIKDSLQGEQFERAAEEEFEDSQGNVLDRRTYEDLARQGLL